MQNQISSLIHFFTFRRIILFASYGLMVTVIGCEPGTMIDPDDIGDLVEEGGGDCDRDNDGVRGVHCGGDDCDEDNPQIGPCQACQNGSQCRRNELCSPIGYCVAAEEFYLKASNAAERDGFGNSVAVDGDRMVVGGAQIFSNAAGNTGAAYVFELQNGRWQQTAYLQASNADEGDNFGISVALDGNRIVVGAIGEGGDVNSTANNPNNDLEISGAAYVFELQNGRWQQSAYLKASNPGLNDNFGSAVSIEQDRIVIGAQRESGDTRSTMQNPNDNARFAGAAYVFELQNGRWQQTAYLKASNANAGDLFGESISLEGSRIAVSAQWEDGDRASTVQNPNDNSSGSGAAYIFELQNGRWQQTAYLKASNADLGDRFGSSISLSGNRTVVGALNEDGDRASTVQNPNNNSPGSGAAYIFELQNGRWQQTAYLKALNADEGDDFGWTIAIEGDRVAVGAHLEDGDSGSSVSNPNNNINNAGASYIYELKNGQWQESAYLKASNAGENDSFGYSIAIEGDWVAVGAGFEAGDADSTLANSNNNARSSGAAYMYSF